MASRTARRLLLTLAATALLMKTLPAASGSEEAVPDAVTLLNKTIRLYSEAQTLQVKARTVLKIEPPERRVPRIERYENNRNAGLLESGAWVNQSEVRIVRNHAYRLRTAQYGMDGTCRLKVPAGWFERSYWQGKDLTPDLIVQRLESTARYDDGTLALGLQGHEARTINLPLFLFLFSRKISFFDPQTATQFPRVAGGEQAVVSLRVKVRHTILPEYPDPFGTKKRWQKFRFGKGEWIIRINRADSLIQQVDLHEEWAPLRPGAPDGVVDLRETYTDQFLNQPLKPEDFLLEPPEPTRAPDLKGLDAGIGKDWEPKTKPEGAPAGTHERDPR
jgi:hypothetical protein